MTHLLFTPLRLGPLTLRNRIVCLPLYLAYPEPDHEVNDLVLEYYAEMADSGAGLVVVENVTVEPCGLGNPRTLLASHDRFVPGLSRLASAIRARGVPAVLQIHHAGRYARRPDRIAPSAIETWGDRTYADDYVNQLMGAAPAAPSTAKPSAPSTSTVSPVTTDVSTNLQKRMYVEQIESAYQIGRLANGETTMFTVDKVSKQSDTETWLSITAQFASEPKTLKGVLAGSAWT